MYIAPLIPNFSTGEDISGIYGEWKLEPEMLDGLEAAVSRNRNICMKIFRLFDLWRKENNFQTVDDWEILVTRNSRY